MKGIEEKGREDCSRKTGFLHGSNPIHMFLDRNSKKKKERERKRENVTLSQNNVQPFGDMIAVSHYSLAFE